MSFAIVPVKTPQNENYFLPDVSRMKEDVQICPMKCDFKLRLKDIFGKSVESDAFRPKKILFHRFYFKVEKILMDFPPVITEGDSVFVYNEFQLNDDDVQEQLTMITIPDSRTGSEVVRMVRTVYDHVQRLLMVLPDSEYEDWIPVGVEISFVG